ncbi:MAG: hypothetical protein KKG59_07435 [Nanoarchaeota archaeon]|nr:hypothetical protein [Nanoarchaeota archaeon]
MGLEDALPLAAATFSGLAIALAYRAEFRRRDQFRNYLEAYLTSDTAEESRAADERLGDFGMLTRVHWDEDALKYQNGDGKPMNLTPLKTVPLNFHWGWGWGSTLEQGLRTHILEEGVKIGADAYFLSNMVSGHGNPMYALTYFKCQK